MSSITLKLPQFLSSETAVSKNGLLCPVEATRVNNLDFIRFMLAVSVIFCHCYVLYYGTEETVEPLWVLSNRQISIGSFVVNFFFVISGFLILQSWNHSARFMDFLRKRVVRIFPAFIVASIVCVFIFAPLGTADSFMPLGYWKLYLQHVNLKDLFLGFVQLAEPQVPWTLNSVPIHGSINAPMWTIRYEFFCYLLIPILFYLGVLKKKAFVLAFFLLAFATQAYQSYQNVYLFGWQEFKVIGKPDFFPRFFTYFAAGMCFYVYRNVIPRSRLLLVVSFVMLVLATVTFDGLLLIQPIFGSYLLFYFAYLNTFSFKDFAKNGDYSYGVYLYAWPIQQLVILFFEKHLDITLMFILSMIFTLACAYLSWHYVEKPFLSFKSKKKTMKSISEGELAIA